MHDVKSIGQLQLNRLQMVSLLPQLLFFIGLQSISLFGNTRDTIWLQSSIVGQTQSSIQLTYNTNGQRTQSDMFGASNQRYGYSTQVFSDTFLKSYEVIYNWDANSQSFKDYSTRRGYYYYSKGKLFLLDSIVYLEKDSVLGFVKKNGISSKDIFVYTANNLLSSITRYLWNATSNSFNLPASKYEYAYDNLNRPVAFNLFDWNSSLANWSVSNGTLKYVYSYSSTYLGKISCYKWNSSIAVWVDTGNGLRNSNIRLDSNYNCVEETIVSWNSASRAWVNQSTLKTTYQQFIFSNPSRICFIPYKKLPNPTPLLQLYTLNGRRAFSTNINSINLTNKYRLKSSNAFVTIEKNNFGKKVLNIE